MIYLIASIILIIIAVAFTLSLLSDLPEKGNLKLGKTIPLIIVVSLTLGFGLHFLLLAIGV
ncbi:MAG: hypothetical protein OdinLCB4_001210 [Candidatus Odinarchaeum yellowstonii]|uniref:Uncharacterized protein n=1 Tax=Odinarchaeota yellowstonii (strain LCB_4) TaxID=1841599 RepID=A0AAF0D2S5_ODILC|nr:MAG: hypothetical protein OdinLCB4_001210 [Candidatus Odinarchaeum yellowstonii]